MQVRRTRSLSCPHVPWPASKHNDNLVHRALNRDGHLSCSRWWKRCAATAQTDEARAVSHTLSEIHSIISLPDAPSRWILTPAVIPTHCLFSFFPSVSVSLFWRATQISFTVSDSPTVLAGSGPDWRRKGMVSGSELRSSPSWDRERTNQTMPLLPHAATHVFSYLTRIQTFSGGSGRQCNLLSMFVTPPYS